MISGESVMTRSFSCALWQVARVGSNRSGLRLRCAPPGFAVNGATGRI
jgi:hypothetical protein